jgi:WD40 repeat protein
MVLRLNQLLCPRHWNQRQPSLRPVSPSQVAPATSMAETFPYSQQLPVLAGTPVPWPKDAISTENAGDLVELARWGKGIIMAITYSPDGTLLAIASSIGIYLYDAKTFAETHFISTNSMIHSLVFSPNGAILASGSYENLIQIWQVSDWSQLHILSGNPGMGLTFSPDGTVLASGSWDRTVKMWQVSDWSEIRTLGGHQVELKA